MKDIVKKGTTNYSLDVFILDSSQTDGRGLTGLVYNSAGLTCYYRRGATGTPTQLTLATQTVGGAHTDGGFVEVDATNMKGQYRLDLSDAILASGVSKVTIMLQGASNMAPCPIEIRLVDYDPEDATRMGLSALPNANAGASGGLVTGDGNVTFTAGVGNRPAVDTQAISGDTAAADNLEKDYDGTGYNKSNSTIGTTTVNSDMRGTNGAYTGTPPTAAAIADQVWDEAKADHTSSGSFGQHVNDEILHEGTAQSGGAATIQFDTGASSVDDFYNEQIVEIVGGTGAGQSAIVSDYTGATRTASVERNWATQPDATSRFRVRAFGRQPKVTQVTSSVGSVTGNVGGTLNGFTSAAKAEIQQECNDALADQNLDHLVKSGVDTNWATTVHNDSVMGQIGDNGTAAYDRTTESLQAIRDRGDAAWTTGGGGSVDEILNIQPLIPNEIDLADTAAWRLGLMLVNSRDDLPSTAEITPGTISIERKAIGGTSWSAVVTDAAMSELAGLIYYDEVFDGGSGYAEGDSIRITFKSQKITVSANDYEIIGTTGRSFFTSIRQTMRGTDGAYTGTPPTAAAISDQVWDEARGDHTAAGSFGEAFQALVTANGSINDVSPDAWAFETDLLETTDKVPVGQTLVMVSGNAKGEAAPILEYAGGTGKIRLDWPLRTTPANGDKFIILAGNQQRQPLIAVQTYVGVVNSQTSFDLHDAPGADDDYIGMLAVFYDLDTDQVSVRRITDFVAATDRIIIDSAPDFTVATEDIVHILHQLPDVTRVTAVADKTGYALSAAGVQAIWDALTSALTTAGSVGKKLADWVVGNVTQIDGSAAAAQQLGKSAKGIVDGAAVAGTLSTTEMTTDLAEATDDHYNGALLIWITGNLAGQRTDITDYVGSSKKLVFTAVTEAPSVGDTFVIV